MANRSDRDPPSLNRVRGEKPTEEMRRGSADSIRASGKKAPHQRPDTKLQSACPSYPNRSLRSGRRPYKHPMGKAIADLLQSKKALTAIATVGVGLLGHLGLNMTTADILPLLSPLMAYIVGQGIADHGKERAKIEKAQSSGG